MREAMVRTGRRRSEHEEELSCGRLEKEAVAASDETVCLVFSKPILKDEM